MQWPIWGIFNVYANFGVSKILVPRVMHELEMFERVWLLMFYLVIDFKFSVTGLYFLVENFLIKCHCWYLDLAYERIRDNIVFNINKLDIDPLYEPSYEMLMVLHILFVLCYSFLLLAYILTYGFKGAVKKEDIHSSSMFYYYFDEVEEECGQIEDGVVYIIYFFVWVLWFYLFNIFASYIILKYLNWFLVIFTFILILGAVVPVSLLNQIGVAFPQYIRGSSRSVRFIFEALLDFVSVSVIIIRFFVQNVRFVFIFIGFFEFYEFSIELQNNVGVNLLPHATWQDYWSGKLNNWYSTEIAIHLLTQLALYIYYVGHLTVVYIAQLAIFVILSFWIFFFLYTTFTLPSSEKYFFYKKYALLK